MPSDPAETEVAPVASSGAAPGPPSAPLSSMGDPLSVQSARAEPTSSGPLGWRILGLIQTIRPHQWVKNVFVVAPLVFAKEIFSPVLLTRAASAFAVFC